MFRKLISNLPFNPSLIGEVAFYYGRLKQEEKLRRLGVVLVVLSLFIQTFAVVSPPQPTLAESDNDIIRGGFSNRDQAWLHCMDTNKDFATILSYHGITCDIVAEATTRDVRSTDYSKQLRSIGRRSMGQTVSHTGKPTNEKSVSIGGTTYHMRNLWAFDSGASSTYKMLEMKNVYGETVFIMYNCGNIVTIGEYEVPKQPAPKPAPKPVNSRPAANFNANCSKISWRSTDPNGAPRVRIYITKNSGNAGSDWDNKGPFVKSIAPPSSGESNNGNMSVESKYKNSTDSYRAFAVISDKLPGGNMDDVNYLRASPAQGVTFGPCESVAPEPEPQVEPPVAPPPVVDVCPNKPGDQTSVSQCDVCPNVSGIQYSLSDCDACPNVPGIQSNSNECYPCPEAEDSSSTTACLELDKIAANLTQDIDDANGTMAKANDTIVYTLTVRNKGDQTVADFKLNEDMSDVLHYATLVDADGGTLDDNDILSWPVQPIAAGETLTKDITVKVDDPIKNTPVSTSDPSAYDLVMNNTFYGESVNITLPRSVGKTVEIATDTLPQTGPGESMLVAAMVTVFVSYFLARTHLLRKETQLIRLDYASAGGE